MCPTGRKHHFGWNISTITVPHCTLLTSVRHSMRRDKGSLLLGVNRRPPVITKSREPLSFLGAAGGGMQPCAFGIRPQPNSIGWGGDEATCQGLGQYAGRAL